MDLAFPFLRDVDIIHIYNHLYIRIIAVTASIKQMILTLISFNLLYQYVKERELCNHLEILFSI